MSSVRFLVPLFGLSLSVSCGARSDLRESAASAGGPGGSAGSAGGPPTSVTGSTGEGGGTIAATSASSSSGGGIGGAGGAGPVVVCNGVTLEAPILTLDEPAGDLRRPGLVVLDTAPKTAAILFAKQGLPQVMGPTERLGTFAGWGDWPPSAPSVVDMHAFQDSGLVPGVALVAASRSGLSAPSLSLFYSDFAGSSTTLVLAMNAGGVTSASSTNPVGGTPLMIAPSSAADSFLSGLSTPDGGNFAFSVALDLPSGVSYYRTIACASTPIAADAAWSEGGWILATAVGTEFDLTPQSPFGDPCSTKYSVIGPASSLNLARIQPSMSGFPATLTQILEMPAPVTRIRMAPRAGGAWAVWSLAGQTSLEGASLSALPKMGTTFQILAQGGTLVPTSFDIEPLGDTVVVAAVDEVAGSADQIQIVALEKSGSVVWSTSFATEGSVDGPLSLQTAPDGSTLLLAWSELPAGATKRRLRIARLTCLGAP